MSEWTEERVRERINEMESARDRLPQSAMFREILNEQIDALREILRLREEIKSYKEHHLHPGFVCDSSRRDGMEEAAGIVEAMAGKLLTPGEAQHIAAKIRERSAQNVIESLADSLEAKPLTEGPSAKGEKA